MLGFMDYVQQIFAKTSAWDQDNSYGSINATARALLDFDTPHGLRLNLSSLASSNFATSYSLGTVGTVDGSISYLYTALPLQISSKSNEIPLRHLIRGYRQLHDLRQPDEPWWDEIWHGGRRVDRRPTLLYGRLYLPASHLEALYLRRISPSTQLKISCVSSSALKSGGNILFLLSNDRGKFSTEYLYSTDSALFGLRGLYNFGFDPREKTSFPEAEAESVAEKKSPGFQGRFSAGAELYYGILNKSGGISTGIRFATLPKYTGFPYTMTLTLNPLMGNLSSTYAVRAGPALALCSRFDFNVYSYESAFQVGLELWRRRREHENLEWIYKKLNQPGLESWKIGSANSLVPDTASSSTLFEQASDTIRDEDTTGVLKARLNQDGAIGFLWEGRVKELLYSCGVTMEFKRREKIFRGVGLEIQYSS